MGDEEELFQVGCKSCGRRWNIFERSTCVCEMVLGIGAVIGTVLIFVVMAIVCGMIYG